MKIVCNPSEAYLEQSGADLKVLLYAQPSKDDVACAGDALKNFLSRKKIDIDSAAGDLLSFALSVISADFGAHRRLSPDGWTRIIDLEIAVQNPKPWNENKTLIESMLGFLSTDIWSVNFVASEFTLEKPKTVTVFKESCVTLLSGGLDSLIGAIDLVKSDEKPLFVSQIVHGDREKQSEFIGDLGESPTHLQLTHAFRSPFKREPSQRARSIIFLCYGIVGATLLKRYREGSRVKLYVCENGLISINPPLTEARIGSLSTRTTHPHFLNLFRTLISNLGFKVDIVNPYQLKTKGEMLKECKDQQRLKTLAKRSTSCGRFTRNKFQHCGRCVPCLIRRASFIEWGVIDRTGYVYKNLRLKDDQHAHFDDVRSAAMAVLDIEARGFGKWFGNPLSMLPAEESAAYREVSERGMLELRSLLEKYKIC